MLRSVNAPSPSRLAVRKTDDFLSPPFSYPLSFPYRLSSSFLRRRIAPFVAFGVHQHRRELEARRTSSPCDDDDDLLPSLSTSSLFHFPSFASVILHLGSLATLYWGASIKFIRPLVAATLQDGSRRLATLCFSTFTLSSLFSLPLSFCFSSISLHYSLSLGSNLSFSLVLVLLVPPSLSLSFSLFFFLSFSLSHFPRISAHSLKREGLGGCN